MFACGVSFSCAFEEMFIEVPQLHNLLLSCPKTFVVACLPSGIILLEKHFIINV